MRAETGEGAVTRAVAEKGTGTRIGTVTGTRTKSGGWWRRGGEPQKPPIKV